ncbi:hypothetical protein GCM10011583_72330 [Streptomyces camponoticapitis]|uniref:Uncharacterized protein n=1 Tax=Streptomyces camponoticapitis TaxID=1616125 RepID=A0ABQ2F041_9ACTN|nr:hypothetical protein [Streptomyces camponoticapitis]GGK29975.1 hypothetical protein GCM10011583_72330 [Streptomyces camponoticapitis]
MPFERGPLGVGRLGRAEEVGDLAGMARVTGGSGAGARVAWCDVVLVRPDLVLEQVGREAGIEQAQVV